MNIKNTLRQVAVLSVATMALTFTGCKKYDEGPALSLRTKKARVVNVWEYQRVFVNDRDISSIFDNATITFKKDNTVESVDGAGNRQTGTWEFASGKEELVIKYSTADKPETWTILKLKEEELWARYEQNGDKIEVRLEED